MVKRTYASVSRRQSTLFKAPYVRTTYKRARSTVPFRSRGYLRTSGQYGRYGAGGELKFFDTAISFLVDLTAEVPATGQLNLIPQGVTESTRVGRACVIKSIQFRANLTMTSQTVAASSTNVWIYIVLDKQANGAAAGTTDVFDFSTAAQLPTALINMNNTKRFRILKKFKMAFNSTAYSSGGTAFATITKMIDWYKKCDIPLDFSSTTGAITEIRSNNIFLVAGGMNADDLISVTGTVRLRFSDK